MTERKGIDAAILVSHTHWDREWYRTFLEFRARLADLWLFARRTAVLSLAACLATRFVAREVKTHASGFSQRSPWKRPKSPSVLHRARPCSMARAAR